MPEQLQFNFLNFLILLTLLSLPFDNGIRTMLRFRRGVVGAADAPAAILSALPAHIPVRHLPLEAYNLPVATELLSSVRHLHQQVQATEQAHNLVAQAVAETLAAGDFPLSLGGDHSLAYPLVQGVVRAQVGKRLGVVYLDAHFDLRPLESDLGLDGVLSSGNAFYRLLSEGVLAGEQLAVVGIYPSGTEIYQSQLNYAHRHNMLVVTDEQCAEIGRVTQQILAHLAGCDTLYLGIDLDVLAQPYAPAVSAPAVRGLSLEFVLGVVRAMQATGKLVGADLMEASSRHSPWQSLFGIPDEETPTQKAEKLATTAQTAAGIIRAFVL
ncbi:MAG TPA: arginase family protein [Anaerolineales bacterium]|nr:arginase family protein [Anaerolineales bacterium]